MIRLQRCALVAAVLAAAALSTSGAAWAHSFLIRSDPPAGSRLLRSPAQLTMGFSEPFVRGSERVRIRQIGGSELKLSAAESNGATLRQPLPRLRGVYVVSWQVLSDDGHVSLGEFAFAVGSSAALPTLGGASGTRPWSDVVASWLFYLGLALSLGGLAAARLVWRSGGGEMTLVWTGFAAATVGAAWELVLVAGARRGDGFSSGLAPSALEAAIRTRPGELTLVALAGTVAAVALAVWRPLRPAAIAPLLAASVATALRGHSGTSGDWWAATADIAHLTGVALWIGALSQVVAATIRAHARGTPVIDQVRR